MVKKTILFLIFIIISIFTCNNSNTYADEITSETALRRIIKGVLTNYIDFEKNVEKLNIPSDDNYDKVIISKKLFEQSSKTGLVFDSTAVTKILPGLVGAGDFDGRLFVRGGRSNELLTIVDGQEIKSPYLWNGKISLVNPLLIENVSFYSGAIPAKYPVSLSGVLDILQKRGNLTKINMELDQNLSELQFIIDGPIQKNRHSFLFSVRKTYYDYFLKIPNTILPHIDSFSQKYLFSISNNHRLLVDMSYYADMMVIDNLDVNQGIKGKHSSGSIRKMVLTKLESDWSSSLNSQLSIGFEDSFTTWKVSKDVPSPNSSTGIAYDSRPVYLKLDLETKQIDGHNLMTGFAYRQENLNYEEENINMLPYLEYPGSVRITNSENYKSSYKLCAVYLHDEFIIEPFSIAAGLRYSWIPDNSLTNATSLQPRLTISLKDKIRHMTVFASIGKYETFNNPVFNSQLVDVLPERVIQYSAGMEQQVDRNWQWKSEIFVKNYSSLVFAIQNPSTGAISGYDNSKIGRVHGFEFLLRKEGSIDWNFWLSYTYSKAKYLESGSSWYYADHDQLHTFNFSGTYKLTNDWNIITNWTVSSGKPYTDIVGANYDTTKNVYVPVKAGKNESRLPGYNNLTVSFEYQQPLWPFQNFKGSTYFGATNLFNHPNVYGYSWSDDYTSKTSLKMLPIVPIFGMRIYF